MLFLKEKNIVLSEIAERTRIPKRTLLALEELDLANLPALPYARGFLKNYLSALDIKDKDKYINQLSKRFEELEDERMAIKSQSEPMIDLSVDYSKSEDKRRFFKGLYNRRWMILIVAIMATLAYFLATESILTLRNIQGFSQKILTPNSSSPTGLNIPDRLSKILPESISLRAINFYKNSPKTPLSEDLKKMSVIALKKTEITIHWKDAKPSSFILQKNEIKHIEYFSTIQISFKNINDVKVKYQTDEFKNLAKGKNKNEYDFQ